MPQIAQQEYKIITPRPNHAAQNDCQALIEIKRAMLGGIIFDCLIENAFMQNDKTLSRVLVAKNETGRIYLYSPNYTSISAIDAPYSPEQYSALLAVQIAEEEAMGGTLGVPLLSVNDGYLQEDNETYLICCDDYKIIVTLDDYDVIEALEKSDVKVAEGENYFNVPFEALSDLIGVGTV